MSLKVGALCAGYAGIELALASVLDIELAWYCEYDKAPAAIMAHHNPDVLNLWDLTKADWTNVPPIDVMTAGYPCQPFSHAGGRKGVEDERHLWPYIATAVGVLRPRLCVFENVRGHLSLGFDEVLRDLHLLGYEVRWYMLRAADVGAAHGRARLFIFAEDTHAERILSRPDRRGGLHRDSGVGRLIPGAPEGHDDGQGAVGAEDDAAAPWRKAGGCYAAAQRSGAGVVHLAADRGGCVCGDRRASTDAVGEGCRRGHRSGVSGDGGCVTSPAERSGDVDGRDARACRDAEVEDSRSEPARTRPDAADAANGEALGDLPPRMVVGVGGGSLRPSGVHWLTPYVRVHGGGSRLLASEVVGAGAPAAPADDAGRGEHWRPVAVRAEQSAAQRFRDDAADGLTLLPTPAVNDMGAAYTPETWDEWTGRMKAEHGNGNGHGKSLNIEALRLLPTPTTVEGTGPGSHGTGGDNLRTVVDQLLPTPPQAADGNGGGRRSSPGHATTLPGEVVDKLMPTPTSSDAKASGARGYGGNDFSTLTDATVRNPQDWREYEAAIRRCEAAWGRPAPLPTEPGAKGQPRLSPRFVEWLMGLPDGWVTDPAIGISRNDQLKALGNGVVPAQCAAALRAFLHDTIEEKAA